MNNDNYSFYLADDQKGNKVLTIIKGELNKELLASIGKINDPNFASSADELIKILNQSTIKKVGDNSCN